LKKTSSRELICSDCCFLIRPECSIFYTWKAWPVMNQGLPRHAALIRVLLAAKMLSMNLKVGIITISDRASQGLYDDLGGPALKEAAQGYGWEVVADALVADEKRDIQRAVIEQLRRGAELVLTTGGTGVALRDITPEAVREIASRELPGFGEIMRMESMKITPNAILSRSLAAVVEKALVICLPGKPKGAVECLGFVVGAIPHCVKVIQEIPTSC
jgi:molybdopterin adenylyltransferase